MPLFLSVCAPVSLSIPLYPSLAVHVRTTPRIRTCDLSEYSHCVWTMWIQVSMLVFVLHMWVICTFRVCYKLSSKCVFFKRMFCVRISRRSYKYATVQPVESYLLCKPPKANVRLKIYTRAHLDLGIPIQRNGNFIVFSSLCWYLSFAFCYNCFVFDLELMGFSPAASCVCWLYALLTLLFDTYLFPFRCVTCVPHLTVHVYVFMCTQMHLYLNLCFCKTVCSQEAVDKATNLPSAREVSFDICC